jgi:hypothetical protein
MSRQETALLDVDSDGEGLYRDIRFSRAINRI